MRFTIINPADKLYMPQKPYNSEQLRPTCKVRSRENSCCIDIFKQKSQKIAIANFLASYDNYAIFY